MNPGAPFAPPERCKWCRRPIVRATFRWLHSTSRQENCGHGGTVATPRTPRPAT